MRYLDRPANPYVERETAGLPPGTALDAGCGAGAEAALLASLGWTVTGVDISPEAIVAAQRASSAVEWIEADLTTWHPARQFDLVTTHYAHASIPHLDLYDRLAGWVVPGGSLLIVGHADDGHHEASVRLDDVVARLAGWRIDTAIETVRGSLHDVVVRASKVEP